MKKITCLTVVLILFFSLSVFANEWKTYKSPFFGFEINYPGDWQMKEFSGVIAFMSPPEGPDDTFSENLNILVEDISAYQMSPEEYAKAADDYWLSSNPGVEIIDSQKTTINAQEVFYAVAVDGQYKFKQYKFIKDNKAYILTYTSETGKPDKFSDTADNIVNTFVMGQD